MSGTTEIELPETMRLEEAPAAPPAEPIETVEAERPKTPHQSAMELIAERYERQQLAGELATGAEIAAASPPIGDQGESEPATASRPTHADPHHAAPHQAPHRTVTIQGQQFQVTEEQYAHLAEMGAMANVALTQARSHAAPAPQPQAAPRHQEVPPLVAPETVREVARRLQFGSAEEGEQALSFVINEAARQAAGVAQQTVAVAHQHQAQQAELNTNLEKIGAEFPELFASERLAQTAALELTALRQRNAMTGARQTNLDLYREACRNVRQLFGTGSQDASRGAAYTGSDDRLERKRLAPRNPSAVSRAAGLGPAPARPPTGSQIVEQMRRSRFQST